MTLPVNKTQRRAIKLAKWAARKACKQVPVMCPLCGAKVPVGQMLEHKALKHGERRVVPSPVQPHRDGWVSIHQGGLPSLGKRSR